jgi:phospholipid/cholesterol/gamma-HCH transport system substrate-binding protein
MNRATVLKGVIVLSALAVLTVLALHRLGPTGGTYRADFSHASGLETGDEVRVAGIPSGTVSRIELDGDAAVVHFDLDPGIALHRDARAAVKLASLLGQNYLEVLPGDGEPLPAGGTIPTDQTTAAYTISQLVVETNDTLGELDLDAVDAAISTLATELDADPDATDRALTSATALSRLISSKDAQLDRLLRSTRAVTGTVREQQDQLENLLVDAGTVATMIERRRDTIRGLLTHGQAVVREISALADENNAEVRELLTQFETVLGTLSQNAEELDLTLSRLGSMGRYFVNATGNGPWIDVNAPYFLLPDNVLCLVVHLTECRT